MIIGGKKPTDITIDMLTSWEEDPEFLQKFKVEELGYDDSRKLLCSHAQDYYECNGYQLPREEIYGHIARIAHNNHFEKILTIISKIGQAKKRKRNMRETILRNSGLNTKSSGLDFFQSRGIPVYRVKYHDTNSQYPPHGHHIFESAAIGDEWRMELMEGKMADKRQKRHPMHLLETEKLQLDIPQDQSAVLVDEATGRLVGYVIRDFGSDPQLLIWAEKIALRATEWQTSVRVRFFFSSTYCIFYLPLHMNC